MEKDYVEIIDKNSYIKKCEVIVRVFNEENGTNYLVYKDKEQYYAAKYEEISGISKMNTDLNREELDFLENVLNSYVGDDNEAIISE